MSRHWQGLPGWASPERVWHFAKYGSVGVSGFLLNASLVWTGAHFAQAQTVSAVVFVLCGQYSFFMHAGLTWRDARERKLKAAWALFVPANWAAGAVNYAVFSFALWLGAWSVACYIAAMLVSVPITYAWNAIVVFPKETMPKERILRLWGKLVEWNKQN